MPQLLDFFMYRSNDYDNFEHPTGTTLRVDHSGGTIDYSTKWLQKAQDLVFYPENIENPLDPIDPTFTYIEEDIITTIPDQPTAMALCSHFEQQHQGLVSLQDGSLDDFFKMTSRRFGYDTHRFLRQATYVLDTLRNLAPGQIIPTIIGNGPLLYTDTEDDDFDYFGMKKVNKICRQGNFHAVYSQRAMASWFFHYVGVPGVSDLRTILIAEDPFDLAHLAYAGLRGYNILYRGRPTDFTEALARNNTVISQNVKTRKEFRKYVQSL